MIKESVKINKNDLSVLSLKDVRSLDNCEWVDSDNLEWFEGEGVYVNECGSRGENDIKKVELDSDGNFFVCSVEDIENEMNKDGDIGKVELEIYREEWESEFGEIVTYNNNKLDLKVIYNVTWGDEMWENYFYFKK